jgi:MFS family permease
MGLQTDLHLTGNDFSTAASSLFIAYLLASIPTGFILNKVPTAKYLALNLTLWGITTSSTAGTFNYTTLLINRIFLGIFAAANAPSLLLITGQWYRKDEQALRTAFWYAFEGVAIVVGGVVSFGFQHAPQTGLAGWRVMFLLLGGITVMAAIAILVVLPDTPMRARLLTSSEKAALLEHVKENRTGIVNHHFRLRQLLEILQDPQIWVLVIATMLVTTSSGIIGTYSSTVNKNVGFSSPNRRTAQHALRSSLHPLHPRLWLRNSTRSASLVRPSRSRRLHTRRRRTDGFLLTFSQNLTPSGRIPRQRRSHSADNSLRMGDCERRGLYKASS